VMCGREFLNIPSADSPSSILLCAVGSRGVRRKLGTVLDYPWLFMTPILFWVRVPFPFSLPPFSPPSCLRQFSIPPFSTFEHSKYVQRWFAALLKQDIVMMTLLSVPPLTVSQGISKRGGISADAKKHQTTSRSVGFKGDLR
jgi:hypothetical protein